MIDPAATEGKQKYIVRLATEAGNYTLEVWGATAVDALATLFSAIVLKQDDLDIGIGFSPPLYIELKEGE